MADSRLSVRDRELFLAEPHMAALSVSARPERGPFTLESSLIKAAGRFTLMVDRAAPTVRWVSVEGRLRA